MQLSDIVSVQSNRDIKNEEKNDHHDKPLGDVSGSLVDCPTQLNVVRGKSELINAAGKSFKHS